MNILIKIGRRLKRTFFELLPAFLFFLVMFHILSASRSLILRQYGIIVQASTIATIGALIMAKVIFLADKIPFLNLYPRRPLLYNVISKTVVFAIAAMVFFILEELIRYGIKTGSFAQAWQKFDDEVNWPAFWLRQSWMSLLILFYCATIELVRVIGKDRIRDIFLKTVKTLVLIFFAASICVTSCGAYESGDFHIWNTNAQEIKIGKATKFTVEEEFRYAETATELFYQHYDFGFAWAFDKRFEVALGYRLIYELYKHKFREEDDPYTNLTWKQNIGNFKLEDRNRIEYRHWRFKEDQVRYRNKLVLKYPVEFKGFKITPHTSNEIFVSSNGTGYNQNRFQSGVEVELNRYFKIDVSYMLQSTKTLDDKWYTTNVLWLKDKISF